MFYKKFIPLHSQCGKICLLATTEKNAKKVNAFMSQPAFQSAFFQAYKFFPAEF